MSFYSKMDALILRMLAKFGMAMTLRRVTGATHNRISGTDTGGTTENFYPSGINLEITKQLRGEFGTINAEDRIYLLDSSTEPLMGDVIVDGGEWSIKQIIPIKPANIALGYKVRIAK